MILYSHAFVSKRYMIGKRAKSSLSGGFIVADDKQLNLIFEALSFASVKHREQKRKDGASPYINHPINVADMMVRIGGISDPEVLAAALLHDTVEDVGVTEDELKEIFGERVASLVMECTDDKSLPKARRKELQVEHAPHKTPDAKSIKIADKISNINDIMVRPPSDWPMERIIAYLDWAEKVVSGLRGQNPPLEKLFDERIAEARKGFEGWTTDLANAAGTESEPGALPAE